MLIRFFDLIKIFNLVKFVFLDLDKLSTKPLLPLSISLLTIALINIEVDILIATIIFSIQVSNVAILLKP